MDQNSSDKKDQAADKKDYEALFKQAMASDRVARIYANGFINGYGNADVVMLLQLNSEPVAFLNMSYTMAKTLAKKLTELINNFEKLTAHEIMTTDVVDKATGKR